VNGFSLGPRDRRNLALLHPDLVRVIERAVRESGVPFLVGDPRARADAAYQAGRAVDLYPVKGKPVTQLWRSDFSHLVAAVRAAARAEGVAMLHGDARGADPAHHALAAGQAGVS
jgi:hypothetical protein